MRTRVSLAVRLHPLAADAITPLVTTSTVLLPVGPRRTAARVFRAVRDMTAELPTAVTASVRLPKPVIAAIPTELRMIPLGVVGTTATAGINILTKLVRN